MRDTAHNNTDHLQDKSNREESPEMTATIIPERLAAIEDVPLLYGAHNDAEYGKKMCVMEAVAFVAGEPRSDHPECACPVISSLLRNWNDRFGQGDHANAERDRLLKPLVPKLVGSRSTKEVEARRREILRDWVRSGPASDWFEAAGMHEHAAAVKANPTDYNVWAAARKAAWDIRSEQRVAMRAAVKAAVTAKFAESDPAAADAVAVADADAVADAVADAAAVAVADAAADADAVADAVAAADAVADAVAAAAAAAAAAADADAAAAAVAVAVADAVAVAAAAAAAVADADAAAAAGDWKKYGSDAYWKFRDAVYAGVKEKVGARYRDVIANDERLSGLKAKHQDGLVATIELMLEVTPESLAA